MTVRVIAEWGQSHGGSLDVAIRQAEATRDAGAWAAKWQIFAPERIASRHARRYWDPTLGGSDSQLTTFTDNGMLSVADWARLRAHCRRIGVEFMATPFDLEAVDLLESIGVDVYKIASGDITYRRLIEKVAATGKPVILSTGAPSEPEIRRTLGLLWNSDVTLLACTLAYPTLDEHAHLGRIETLRSRFVGYKVGYSDHTLGHRTSMPAAALGASVLEKHCTLGDRYRAPDDSMALNPNGLRLYVHYAEMGAAMRGNPRLVVADEEQPARVGARRSAYAARTIPAGTVLADDEIVWLRPYDPDGVGAHQNIVGRTLREMVAEGDLIRSDMLK